MNKVNLQTVAAAIAMTLAMSASFFAGTAHGQRGAVNAEGRSAAPYIKLRDGRLVRPVSPAVQAKADAAVNGSLQLAPSIAGKVDLEAGQKACVAACTGAVGKTIEAEQCEPNPANVSGGTSFGNALKAGDQPCKSTKTISVSGTMLCEMLCAEKFAVPK